MTEPSIAGVVLAGGRSSRLGGAPKAMLDLGGRPLLAHVIGRFRPQVRRLLLSVERPHPDWAVFGLQQVGDPEPGFRGPLGGLLAAMEAVAGEAQWLALAPCDAPFLPLDAVARLVRGAGAADAAVARIGDVPQPTVSLWRCRLLEPLRDAVAAQGMAGFHAFLAGIDWAPVDWPPADERAFFNINDPDTLAAARRLVAGDRETRAC